MSTRNENVLESLPLFSDGIEGKNWEGLRIEGLVSNPLNLSVGKMSEFPQQQLTEDFRCTHGWVVPDLNWRGVQLRDLLELADPSPTSNYVSIRAGDYVVGLTLYEVYSLDVLVALQLNQEALPLEHGGPCRLVVSGKQCHYSVKWIDSIEVTSEKPEETI